MFGFRYLKKETKRGQINRSATSIETSIKELNESLDSLEFGNLSERLLLSPNEYKKSFPHSIDKENIEPSTIKAKLKTSKTVSKSRVNILYKGIIYNMIVNLDQDVNQIKTFMVEKSLIPVAHQMIFKECYELKSGVKLRTFNIKDGMSLTLEVKISIRFKLFDLLTISYSCNPLATINQIDRHSLTLNNGEYKLTILEGTYDLELHGVPVNTKFPLKSFMTKMTNRIEIKPKSTALLISTEQDTRHYVLMFKSQTILDLKSAINFKNSLMTMKLNGTKLEDDTVLSDLPVKCDQELVIKIGISGIQIFVRGFKNKTLVIDVNSSDFIEVIKNKIEEKEGIPPHLQKLYFGGKLLEDERTLSYYNIGHESTLQIYLRNIYNEGELIIRLLIESWKPEGSILDKYNLDMNIDS